jgi:hypothetical protein
MKQCNKCNETLTVDNFHRHPYNKDRLFNTCKVCYTKGEVLKGRLKLGFSMYKPDSCECCGNSNVKLDLDHCHETGMFRGFICRSCNKTIALNGDTYESLVDADADQLYLDYLRLANYRMGKIV